MLVYPKMTFRHKFYKKKLHHTVKFTTFNINGQSGSGTGTLFPLSALCFHEKLQLPLPHPWFLHYKQVLILSLQLLLFQSCFTSEKSWSNCLRTFVARSYNVFTRPLFRTDFFVSVPACYRAIPYKKYQIIKEPAHKKVFNVSNIICSHLKSFIGTFLA